MGTPSTTEGGAMTRVAFYKAEDGRVFCDPCSLRLCAANHALALSRTYAAQSSLSFPRLTCEACGQSHVVKQS